MKKQLLKSKGLGVNDLEAIYKRYNHPDFIHPDPLEFVHRYQNPRDQELVGLLVSALAYGNVKQILRSAEMLFKPMGKSPYLYVIQGSHKQFHADFDKFYHRWHTGRDIALFLERLQVLYQSHKSLESVFLTGHSATAPDIFEGLEAFICALTKDVLGLRNNFLPQPSRGSACKRLHMYLRWMVRKDAIDLGIWKNVSPAQLLVPVDTHMHAMSRKLKFTRRNAADLKTVREVTEAFRKISPADPVRYDFALTRLGIRREEFHPLSLEGRGLG